MLQYINKVSCNVWSRYRVEMCVICSQIVCKQIEIPVPRVLTLMQRCHRARREGNYYIPDLVMGSLAYLSETGSINCSLE